MAIVKKITLLLCLLACFISLQLPASARNGCLESALNTIITNNSVNTRSLEAIPHITVMTYNVLNLTGSVGKWQRNDATGVLELVQPKFTLSAEQIASRAKAIRDVNPDVVILQEIEGGLGTLNNFNREQLQDMYNCFLVIGNDGRGIDVGMMIRRDLPLTTELQTHRDVKWVDPSDKNAVQQPLFSRDLPALLVRTRNQDPALPPLFILLGNHGKSKRPTPGDPLSSRKRPEQAQGMEKIVNS